MQLSDIRHRKQFGEYLNSNGLFGFGCEIGVLYGTHAESLLKSWRGMTLFCVDPWKKFPASEYIDGAATVDLDEAYFEALNKLAKFPGRVSFVRHESDRAVEFFSDKFFDFVYIDGNHHMPQVGRDLDNWWLKVRSGGIFCGHDYYNTDLPYYKCDVKTAVDAFVAKHGLTLHTSIDDSAEDSDASWWIEKP